MKKSKTEKLFDEIADKYFEKFNSNYPLVITDMRPLAEHIKIMQDCIKADRPAPSPDYNKGNDD